MRGWRLPVWLAFAALAAWQVRLVPFFAVVAGPITALNLGERLPALNLRTLRRCRGEAGKSESRQHDQRLHGPVPCLRQPTSCHRKPWAGLRH